MFYWSIVLVFILIYAAFNTASLLWKSRVEVPRAILKFYGVKNLGEGGGAERMRLLGWHLPPAIFRKNFIK